MAGLVIDGNERFEKHWAVFQTVAIVIMALLVLLAFLGGAGSGPFSTATKPVPAASATLTYGRFETKGTSSALVIDFAARGAVAEHSLVLDPAYLRHHRITSIQPQPASATVGAGGIRYSFGTRDGRGTVVVAVEPAAAGRARGNFTVDGVAVAHDQLVLP